MVRCLIRVAVLAVSVSVGFHGAAYADDASPANVCVLQTSLQTGTMQKDVVVQDVLEARYRTSTESPVSWIDLLTDKVGFLLFLR